MAPLSRRLPTASRAFKAGQPKPHQAATRRLGRRKRLTDEGQSDAEEQEVDGRQYRSRRQGVNCIVASCAEVIIPAPVGSLPDIVTILGMICKECKSDEPEDHTRDLESKNSPHVIRLDELEGGKEYVCQEDEGKNRGEDVQAQAVPIENVVSLADDINDEGGQCESDDSEDALENANWEEPCWSMADMRMSLAVAIGVHVVVELVRHLCGCLQLLRSCRELGDI